MKINSSSNNETLIHAHKAKEEEKTILKDISSDKTTDITSSMFIHELLSQTNSMSQGIRNANDALGILQIADGVLSSISDSAIKMNELSIMLENPALDHTQRSIIENQSNALYQSMQESIAQATFNGKNIFNGNMSFETSSGIQSLNLEIPSLNSLKANDQQSITNFLENLSHKRTDIGSVMNGIQSRINAEMDSVVAQKAVEKNFANNNLDYNQLDTTKLKENAALYANAFNTQNLAARLDFLLR